MNNSVFDLSCLRRQFLLRFIADCTRGRGSALDCSGLSPWDAACRRHSHRHRRGCRACGFCGGAGAGAATAVVAWELGGRAGLFQGWGLKAGGREPGAIGSPQAEGADTRSPGGGGSRSEGAAPGGDAPSPALPAALHPQPEPAPAAGDAGRGLGRRL